MSEPTRSWKDVREDFMNFTRAERRGVIVLFVLILLVNIFNFYIGYIKEEKIDYSEAIAEIEAAYAVPNEKKDSVATLFPFNPNLVTASEMEKLGFAKWKVKTFMKYRATGAVFKNEKDFGKVYSIDSLDLARVKDYLVFETKKPKEKVGKKVEKLDSSPPTPLFDFDPNTANESELLSLGLPKKVVSTMLKFRKKGGFRRAADVAKIYGLDAELYQKLLPHIKIAKTEKTIENQSNKLNYSTIGRPTESEFIAKVKPAEIALESIDINTATIEEWQRIQGIGPAYANRIVNFRDKLGGFYSIEQIQETYGIEDSIYQKIVPYVKVSEPKNKMKVNIENVETLAKHPYLSWSESQVIFNYIKKHGAFKDEADVYKCRRFTKEEWQRILPYFDYSTKVDTFDHDSY